MQMTHLCFLEDTSFLSLPDPGLCFIIVPVRYWRLWTCACCRHWCAVDAALLGGGPRFGSAQHRRSSSGPPRQLKRYSLEPIDIHQSNFPKVNPKLSKRLVLLAGSCGDGDSSVGGGGVGGGGDPKKPRPAAGAGTKVRLTLWCTFTFVMVWAI